MQTTLRVGQGYCRRVGLRAETRVSECDRVILIDQSTVTCGLLGPGVLELIAYATGRQR